MNLPLPNLQVESSMVYFSQGYYQMSLYLEYTVVSFSQGHHKNLPLYQPR